jgi:hypothetical protein
MRRVSAIAAEVTPRSAARGEVGPHHQFGAHQARGAGHAADAGQAAQLAFDLGGVLRQQFAVLAGQHQHVLLVGEPPKPTLTRAPGTSASALAQLRSMACLDFTPLRCCAASG